MNRILLLGIVLLVIPVVGCRSTGQGSSIGSDQEYMATLRQTQDLTLGRLSAFESGATLSAQDRAELEEGLKLFRKLIDYAPTLLGPQVGAGRICRAIGDNDRARRYFEQALLLQQEDRSAEAEELRASVFANLGELDLIENKFEQGEKLMMEARKRFPKDAQVVVVLASIHVQMKKLDLAKRELQEARKLDPTNSRAISLEKLLKAQG